MFGKNRNLFQMTNSRIATRTENASGHIGCMVMIDTHRISLQSVPDQRNFADFALSFGCKNESINHCGSYTIEGGSPQNPLSLIERIFCARIDASTFVFFIGAILFRMIKPPLMFVFAYAIFASSSARFGILAFIEHTKRLWQLTLDTGFGFGLHLLHYIRFWPLLEEQ